MDWVCDLTEDAEGDLRGLPKGIQKRISGAATALSTPPSSNVSTSASPPSITPTSTPESSKLIGDFRCNHPEYAKSAGSHQVRAGLGAPSDGQPQVRRSAPCQGPSPAKSWRLLRGMLHQLPTLAHPSRPDSSQTQTSADANADTATESHSPHPTAPLPHRSKPTTRPPNYQPTASHSALQ